MNKNYYDSMIKWELFLEIIKTGEYTKIINYQLLGKCGFCREFKKEEYDIISIGKWGCRDCPLYKDKLCQNKPGNSSIKFWEILKIRERFPLSLGLLENLTREMIIGMKKYKKKFKKEK